MPGRHLLGGQILHVQLPHVAQRALHEEHEDPLGRVRRWASGLGSPILSWTLSNVDLCFWFVCLLVCLFVCRGGGGWGEPTTLQYPPTLWEGVLHENVC